MPFAEEMRPALPRLVCFALFALLQLVWLNPAGAAPALPALELRQASTSYPLGAGLSVLPDPQAELSLEQALAAWQRGEFTPAESARPRLDFRWKAAWLALSVVNHTDVTKWRLWQPHPMPDHLDAYWVVRRRGETTPPKLRELEAESLFARKAPARYPRRGLTLELELPPGHEAVVFLHYRGRLQAVTAELSTHERFDTAYSEGQLAHGVFYGILLALLFYNLGLYVFLRDIAYAYYVVHVGSTLFFFFIRNAHIGELPQTAWFGELIAARWELTTVLVHWVICIGVTGFCRALFDTRTSAPRLDRALKWIAVSPAIGAVVVLASDGRYGDSLAGLSQLAGFVTVLWTGVVMWRRGDVLARLYLTAWAALLLTSALYVLRYFGALPYNRLTEFAPQVGVGLEAVLLSLTLAYRVRRLQFERSRAVEEASRARAERDVRVARERTRGLTELVEATDSERRRLARELHDGLGQLLTGAKALVETARARTLEAGLPQGNKTGDGAAAAGRELEQASELLTRGIEEARGLSHGLHPERLDRVGLTASLRGLVDEFPERDGLTVDAEIRDVDGLLAKGAEVHLYRIAQEAIRNAWVHGGGSTLSVSVTRDGGRIELVVSNDGARFDLEAASGLGLTSIRERCAALGAELSIEAPAEGGAELSVRVPTGPAERA